MSSPLRLTDHDTILDWCEQGNKIQAIKAYRVAINHDAVGLLEAKRTIDDVMGGIAPNRSKMSERLLAHAKSVDLTAGPRVTYQGPEVRSPDPDSVTQYNIRVEAQVTNDLLRLILAALRENTEILKDLAFERGD